MSKQFGPGELQTSLLRRLADGECLTLSVLAREYGISDKRISKAASSLHARGYLMRAVAGCYRLTDDGLAAVARGEVITSGPIDADATVLERAPTNGFRDKLWRTMRAQREFTVVDIVMDAADGEKDCVNDAYGTGSAPDFAGSMPVGQLVMIGVNYRSPSVQPRIYINQSVSTGSRAVNAEIGFGIRLSIPGVDLYEAVLANGSPANDEADAIAAAICTNWGLVNMPNALVLEGDSVLRGAGPDSANQWWARAQNQAGMADIIPANCKLFNTAFSGHTIDQITAQRDSTSNWMTTAKSAVRNKMILQMGANNVSEAAEIIRQKYAAYFTGENGVLARGLDVQVVANIGSTDGNVPKVTLRNWLSSPEFLEAIEAGPGQTYEGRVKVVQPYLAEEGGIRPLFVDAGGGAYFSDAVHPNAEGTRVMTTGGDTPRYGIMADVA